MKLFKDNATGEMLISITERKENLLHFDDSPCIGNLDNVSEVDTDGSVSKFHRQHIIEEVFDINDDVEWHLKDIIYVPIKGEIIVFRVEHISYDKAYFVAVNSVGESSMTDINQFLDDYLESMPKSLVDRMTEIEHKTSGEIVRKSKLALLSYANIVRNTGNYELDGTDDIPFDGLLTEAERCKNDENGETRWYWLDTPGADYSTAFLSVSNGGYPGIHYFASSAGAVVPCFALKRSH